jgi:CBS domain-containing protein
VSFDDLLRDMARTLARVPDSTAAEAREAYIRACRRVDENRAEQQRIGDIADLLDAEETLYAQARAAADRGDTAAAIPLLRQCAEAGTGEAAWLLAQLLEDTGDTAEAVTWYRHARDDGDDRADGKLAALRARPCPHAALGGSPPEDRAAAAGQSAPRIFVSHTSGRRTWSDRLLGPAVAAGPADLIATACNADWIVISADGPGHALHGGLPPTIIPPVVMFSYPASDHFPSIEEAWRAHCLAHDTSRVRALIRLTKRLNVQEPATTPEWALAFYRVLGKSQAAASRWRLDYKDYDRPCPANLGRYLAAAEQWHPQWTAREPVVAEVMLPPSEVPDCRPDTTVAQALELLVQSGTQALPVCELTRVTGIVTLADLARHISDHQGVPPAAGTIRALMRPAAIVPPSTPLPAIAKAIADDGIIVVSSSGDQPDGYLTAESLLTQAPPGTSAQPAPPYRPSLLVPGTGAVLLNHDR